MNPAPSAREIQTIHGESLLGIAPSLLGGYLLIHASRLEEDLAPSVARDDRMSSFGDCWPWMTLLTILFSHQPTEDSELLKGLALSIAGYIALQAGTFAICPAVHEHHFIVRTAAAHL